LPLNIDGLVIRKSQKWINTMTTKRILSIIFIIIGIICGKLAYNALFVQSDIAEYEDTDWIKSNYLGVTYEAPFELSPMDLQLPQNAKNYIKEMENYKFESNPIAFIISRVEYQAGVTTSINGAVDGAVQNMQAQKGITEFSYKVSNIDSNFIEGRLIKGTCKADKKDAEFIVYIYLKNLKLLQIMAMNLDFPENREIRNRIIKSIRFEL
jgi:hypothetical protein